MNKLWVLAAVGMIACKGGKEDSDGGPDDTSDTGGLDFQGWSEGDWCGDMADLSDLEAGYNGTNLRVTLQGISQRRYPPALGLIEAQTDAELNRWFTGSMGSFRAVMDRYEVAVHEGAHIWGFDRFSFDSYSYRVVDDGLIIETAFLDNFDRSEILSRHPDASGDFYASTYLEGASGAQGFNTLLDEYNAYTHSLASRHCTRDYLGGASTSARDGILTFMWYVETYLKIAREEHTADYRAIQNDPAHVEMILTVWDRAEYWLEVTADEPGLGIDDDALKARVYEADNLDEIERLR